MSRVGGGGYAENRGGFGDRTGGGMSGNARDGLGGNGRGGDHNFAAERTRLRALGATTVTPQYGWDQAQISDFGITGGLMNAFKGVLAGNTYAGRTPLGLQGGFAADPAQRSMQAMQGGYGQSLFNPIQYNAIVRGGMYGGGQNQFKLQQMQGGLPMPMPAPKPQAPAVNPLQPLQAPGVNLSVGGGSLPAYGVNLPGYSYYGSGY